MFGGILRLITTVGSVVSGVLSKRGRYIPGLDEVLDILKEVAPIVAMSEHPDAPNVSMKVNKILSEAKDAKAKSKVV